MCSPGERQSQGGAGPGTGEIGMVVVVGFTLTLSRIFEMCLEELQEEPKGG